VTKSVLHSDKLNLDQPLKDKLHDIVLSYLQGCRSNNSSACYAIEDVESDLYNALGIARRAGLNISCKALYQAIPVNPLEHNYQDIILVSLDISEESPLRHSLLKSSQNLYQLLQNIHHNGEHHLKALITKIDETTQPHPWDAYLTTLTLVVGGIGAMFYIKQDFFWATVEWILSTGKTTTALIIRTLLELPNIALIGLGYNVILLAYQWYCTFAYGTIIPKHKLSRLTFVTLGKTFNIAAYLLSYLAAGVMTPISAMPFIVGSLMDVLGGIYDLLVLYHPDNPLLSLIAPKAPNPEVVEVKDEPWAKMAARFRQENHKDQLWGILWVKLVAAIILSTSVIICCVFPPSAFLSILCFIVGCLVALARNAIIQTIEQNYDDKLQNKLFGIKKFLIAEQKLIPEEKLNETKQLTSLHLATLVLQCKLFKSKLSEAESMIGKQQIKIKALELDLAEVKGQRANVP
jgi:hypothetical protein